MAGALWVYGSPGAKVGWSGAVETVPESWCSASHEHALRAASKRARGARFRPIGSAAGGPRSCETKLSKDKLFYGPRIECTLLTRCAAAGARVRVPRRPRRVARVDLDGRAVVLRATVHASGTVRPIS